jgi:hypothetical protein
MNPAGQRLLLANAAQFLSEQQERRLKRIFGILMLLQHAPANAICHRPVPPNQRFEGGIVPVEQEALDQLLIGLLAQERRRHSTRQALQTLSQAGRLHDDSPVTFTLAEQ